MTLWVIACEIISGIIIFKNRLFAKDVITSISLKMKLLIVCKFHNIKPVEINYNYFMAKRSKNMEIRLVWLRYLQEKGVSSSSWNSRYIIIS